MFRCALCIVALGCGGTPSHGSRSGDDANDYEAHVEPDMDADRVLDSVDGCPDAPEDHDGFQDDDGCPDEDNDGDGIADVNDVCLNEAEDHDGLQDDDGCPDPDSAPVSDRDADGIADAVDACPDDAEVVNGLDDDDGCPDARLCSLVGRSVSFSQPIAFRPGSTAWDSDADEIVDRLAMLLRAEGMPPVTLRVVTGRSGDEALARRRGAALRQALIDRGVAAEVVAGAPQVQRPVDLGPSADPAGNFATIEPSAFRLATTCDGAPVEPMRIEDTIP
ncbi:MAG: hypothetical protein AAF411_02995 [Myxococcota bacterium]